jgi:hypothetical protein
MFGFAGMDMATALLHDCPSRQPLRALPSPSLATGSFDDGRLTVPSRATMFAQAPLHLPGNTFLAQRFTLGEFRNNLGQPYRLPSCCVKSGTQDPATDSSMALRSTKLHSTRARVLFQPSFDQHVTAWGFGLLLVTVSVLPVASCILYPLLCPLPFTCRPTVRGGNANFPPPFLRDQFHQHGAGNMGRPHRSGCALDAPAGPREGR